MVQRNSLTIFTSKMDDHLSSPLFMTHGKILKVNISAKRCKELNLSKMKDKTACNFDVILLTAGETLHTFTIVTTSSSSALQWLHGESCTLNFCIPTEMTFYVDIFIVQYYQPFTVLVLLLLKFITRYASFSFSKLIKNSS